MKDINTKELKDAIKRLDNEIGQLTEEMVNKNNQRKLKKC